MGSCSRCCCIVTLEAILCCFSSESSLSASNSLVDRTIDEDDDELPLLRGDKSCAVAAALRLDATAEAEALVETKDSDAARWRPCAEPSPILVGMVFAKNRDLMVSLTAATLPAWFLRSALRCWDISNSCNKKSELLIAARWEFMLVDDEVKRFMCCCC